MKRTLALIFTLSLGMAQILSAATGEDSLLLLHNGAMVCGIVPQIGGRVVVFRKENGDNVLDARPEMWKDAAVTDLLTTNFKQYYGESVWSGPQWVWWSDQEPYPPPPGTKPAGFVPPDPAWELAAFTVVEQTPTRVVLRSPVSKLTGMELTKTIELQPDGQLKIHEKAVNRGDKALTRDLWLLHRVNPASTTFVPLKSVERVDRGVWAAGDVRKVGDLTVVQLRSSPPIWGGVAQGKIRTVPQAGWMATSTPGGFFIVHFQATDETKTAPNQTPVEIYLSSYPEPLIELEHHGEIKTLQPGDAMESEEMWQIVPYTGAADVDAQAKFLQTTESTPTPAPADVPTAK